MLWTSQLILRQQCNYCQVVLSILLLSVLRHVDYYILLPSAGSHHSGEHKSLVFSSVSIVDYKQVYLYQVVIVRRQSEQS